MKQIFALRASLLLLTLTLFVAATSALSAQAGKQPVYASLRSLGTVQTPPNPFTLELVGPQAAVTEDVLSGAGDWTFVITVNGKVSALGIKIKNNPSAGDVCWSYYQKSPKSGSTVAFSIPAASLGICGNEFPDTNGDALTVYAFTQGGKSANVKISVTYPPLDEAVGVGARRPGFLREVFFLNTASLASIYMNNPNGSSSHRRFHKSGLPRGQAPGSTESSASPPDVRRRLCPVG